jgi:hypothetical protein
LANEVDILGSDSNELGNTTRHFILYGEFIFKLTFYKLDSHDRVSSFHMYEPSGRATGGCQWHSPSRVHEG